MLLLFFQLPLVNFLEEVQDEIRRHNGNPPQPAEDIPWVYYAFPFFENGAAGVRACLPGYRRSHRWMLVRAGEGVARAHSLHQISAHSSR